VQNPDNVENASKSAEAGLSLIETMMAMTVLAILSSIAAPSFRNSTASQAINAADENLVGSLQFARTQAMALGLPVRLCRSGSGANGLPQCDNGASDSGHDGFEDGWLVFTDANGNGQPDQASDLLRRSRADLNSMLTIRGNTNVRNDVAFTNVGTVAGTLGQLVLCGPRGWSGGGHFAQVVVIGLTGHVDTVPGDQNPTSKPVSSCTP
jgi:type IV fimbrial biogenesis protein FimT